MTIITIADETGLNNIDVTETNNIQVETSNWVQSTLALNTLSDVTITGVTDGQVLAYVSASSKWVNSAAGSGAVTSVAGKVGVVTLQTSNITNFDTGVSANSNVSANTTHISSDGTDHANVVLNDTHRASDGTNHTNVVLNDTHRGVTTGNPHSVSASDLSLGNVSNVSTEDTAYNATSWNTNSNSATKNAIRDKVETMDTAIGLNTSKVTNVSTNLSEGTSTNTTVKVNSSDGTDATLVSASTSRAGLLTKAKWDEIVVNNAKSTNVSTALSLGTVNTTTVSITSDGGSDDVTLPAATVSAAGMFTTAKWGEVVANNAKVTNANHTGDVTGATALTIAVDAVDIAMLSATGSPTSSNFLRGDNTWSTPSGSGDVSKVGTPINNQVGIWTGDGTIEGDVDLTFDGTNLTVGNNIVVGGTVDGIDIATDVAANTTHRGSNGSDHSFIDQDVSSGVSPTLDSANLSGVGGQFTLANVSGATYTSLQHLQNIFHSAGWVSGGGITDDADGTISVAAGTGLIRATDSPVAEMLFFDWAAESGANVALVDNDISYVYAEYNSGSPRVVATITERTDFNTNVLLAVVSREGTELHINETDRHEVGDHANSMVRRLKDTLAYARVSGAVLSSPATVKIAVTAGEFWRGLTEFTTSAVDTNAAGTFSYYYKPSGSWTKVASQTDINNTQYNNFGTGLATLSNNKYGVHWVYLEADDDELTVIYGVGDYTLAEAEDVQPPSSVPQHIEMEGILVGKIIIKKSDSTFTQIESAFETTFQGSLATDHNSLTNLQGGTSSEFYHLTSANHGFIDQDVKSASTPTFTNTNFTDSTDKRYVTDAESTVIGNTSGSNSGDQTIPTVSDTAYNATTWDANADAASKNAIRDKIDAMDTTIGANTSKVTNATHTGDVTGSVALTIAAKAVDIAMLNDGTDGELITWSATGVATTVAVGTNNQVLTSNGVGVAPTFQAASGGGDVSKVGTPINNQVGIWTGDGTIEGDADLTFDGTNLTVGNNIIVGGTVDGIDIATDVAANTSKTTNANHTGDVTGATSLTIAANAVDDTHIDWGTGANQVSADDIPDGSTNAIITLAQETTFAAKLDNLDLDPTPDSNISWNGFTSSFVAGEDITFGKLGYLKSDGKIWLVDADAVATTKGLVCLSTAEIDANNTGTFLLRGYIRDDSWTWTIGADLYGSVTPGLPTHTAPSGTGDVVRIVGQAYNADVIWFNPDNTYIEIA